MNGVPAVPLLLHDAMLRTAATRGDNVAVRVDDASHTYDELARATHRLAGAFQRLGAGPGTRVAMFVENGWPAAVTVFAASMAGAAFVPINAGTKRTKLTALLRDSEPTVLVADARLERTWRPALDALANRPVTVRCGRAPHDLGAPSPRSATIVELDELLSSDGPMQPAVRAIPTDLAAILYTSGSTGEPKGVMVSHQSVRFICGEVAAYLGVRDDDRIASPLSVAFGYGLYQLLIAAERGASLSFGSFSYPSAFAALLRAERATILPAVPTMLSALVAQRDLAPFEDVRVVTNAGAALSPQLVPRVQALFPAARIFAMYGQTECKRVCFLDPDELVRRPLSVGRPMRGTDAFVVAADGTRAKAGETGILHVRGPHLMLGYWNQPAETAQVLRTDPHGDRVLSTNDWFRTDADGYLYFVARSDDIIKTRGEKVSPTEVEHALCGIEGVHEVCVVGVPDDLLGQAVVALVVAEPGYELHERSLRRTCHEQLETHMVPQRVIIVDALPKTENGKIRRLDVKAQFERSHPQAEAHV